MKVVGKVVEVEAQSDGQYTYEVCDTTAHDPNTAPRFTVIRYHGIDVSAKRRQDNPVQAFSLHKAKHSWRALTW